MTDTTAMNRRVAAKLGWTEQLGDGYQPHRVWWANPAGGGLMDGSAWSNDAQVALDELLPEIDDIIEVRFCADGRVRLWVAGLNIYINSTTLATGLCDAYLGEA